ncbi:hypothetical protein [Agilicoccus flavus]|uniref:hypothetical protein n=1 Tax=Agilicoccus flavus TaxID=2775968 RepID=UPI001CF68977|nr:hypothetical protein [Agilicoccus flavus]
MSPGRWAGPSHRPPERPFAHPRGRSRRRAWASVLVLAWCVAAACTSAPAGPAETTSRGPSVLPPSAQIPATEVTPDWREVALRDGVLPVTAVVAGTSLLVGGYAPDAAVRPRLLLVEEGSVTRDVPARPGAGSPYAPLARWTSLATDGRRVVAVGGAPGGAHANTRWTTWEGDLAEIRERPQSFYAFGGWGAGGLVGAAITPAGPVLAGSWEGAAGLDAALWTLDSRRRWVRRDSAATPLASTATELAGVSGVTAAGDGVLVAGSVTHLRPGSVQRAPAVWRTRSGADGAARVDLPEGGSVGEATGADCDPSGCVVLGRVDDRGAWWWAPGSGPALRLAAPDAPAPTGAPAPAPALRGDRLAVAAGDRVFLRTGGRWASLATPAAPVREVHLRAGGIDVIAGDAASPGLWTTTLP